MDQAYVQPQIQPQFVMMPVAQHNGLGVFGLIVALIGFFIPTGIIAILGLVLSLAAIGRSPRLAATCGVIVGLVGTLLWLLIDLAVLVAGVLAAIGAFIGVSAAFVLTQPEVVELSSDMINVAIAVEDHQKSHGEMPDDLDGLGLSMATLTDPWGRPYRFMPADCDPGYDVVSDGPDGKADTEDDVSLSRFDKLWEKAFEDFGEKMEELGEKLDRIDGMKFQNCSVRTTSNGVFVFDYEEAARRAWLERQDGKIEVAIPMDVAASIKSCGETSANSDCDHD